MGDFLITMAGISLLMSVVTLVTYAFRRVLHKKFTAKCRYIILAAVVLRLCIPFSLFSGPALINIPVPKALGGGNIGEFGIIPETVGSVIETAGNADNITVGSSFAPSVEETGVSSESPENDNNVSFVPPAAAGEQNVGGFTADIGGNVSAVTPEATVGVENIVHQEAKNEEIKRGYNVAYTLFGIWLTGAVFFLLIDMIEYLRFFENTEGTKYLPEDGIISLYNGICRKKGVKKQPSLYLSDTVTSPMLIGVFRPMIILPDIDTDVTALEGILSHELTHYKRRDLWVKLAAVIAKAVHWFNPAAHLAIRMMNEEMELSCDEITLEGASEEVRVRYGEVMVDILRNCKGKANIISTHFNPEPGKAKERIMNIFDNTKKKKGVLLTALCLLVCAVAGTVFGCAGTQSEGAYGGESEVHGGEYNDVEEKAWVDVAYDYNYCRVEYITNADNRIFGYVGRSKNLSGGDHPVFRFNSFEDFRKYISMFGNRSDYENKDQFSNIPLTVESDSSLFGYDVEYFEQNSLIVVHAKEKAGKCYTVSGVSTADDTLKIELYPVVSEGEKMYNDGDYYTCQFYLVEVPKDIANGCTEFVVEENKGVEKLYYSAEADSLRWDILEEKTKAEYTDKGEYKHIDFYTDNEKWKLFYDIDGASLTLTNGKVSYTFDDARDSDPTYNVMFFPQSGAQSASAVISPDERYAVVIFENLRFVYGEVETYSAYLIDLTNGRLLKTVSSFDQYELDASGNLFYTNGLDSKYVKGYTSILGYTASLYSTDIIAEFGLNDTVVFHRQLLTVDNKLRLYDKGEFTVGDAGMSFVGSGEYKGLLSGKAKFPENDGFALIDDIDASDVLKEAVKAFLNKDVRTLENYTWNEKGVLENYKNLEFGEYSVQKIDPNGHGKLLLTVDVKKADGTAIALGEQQFEIYTGVTGVVFKYVSPKTNKTDALTELETKFLLNWFNVVGLKYKLTTAEDIAPSDMKEYSFDVYEFIYQFIRSTTAENGVGKYSDGDIAVMCKKYASELFGLTDHSGESVFVENGGELQFMRGHGGAVYKFEAEEDGEENSCIIQFYADSGATVKSHRVKYTIIPGDIVPQSFEYEILEKAEYEPYFRYQ